MCRNSTKVNYSSFVFELLAKDITKVFKMWSRTTGIFILSQRWLHQHTVSSLNAASRKAWSEFYILWFFFFSSCALWQFCVQQDKETENPWDLRSMDIGIPALQATCLGWLLTPTKLIWAHAQTPYKSIKREKKNICEDIFSGHHSEHFMNYLVSVSPVSLYIHPLGGVDLFQRGVYYPVTVTRSSILSCWVWHDNTCTT